MRNVALVLLVAGVIVGTLGGARLPDVDWRISGGGLLLIAVATVILRRRQADTATPDGERGPDALETIRSLPDRVKPLVETAKDAPLSELVQAIGVLDAEVLFPLGEAAPAELGKLGTARFTEVFGAFATAERQLARSWSAAADGHRPEAIASLERAIASFDQAARAAET